MLSVARLCSRSLTRQLITNVSLTTSRNFCIVVKKPVSLIGILKCQMNNIGQISKCLRKSGTIALNHSSAVNKKTNKIVGSWLLVCSGMVFVAVGLGIGIYCFIYDQTLKIIKEIVDKTYGK